MIVMACGLSRCGKTALIEATKSTDRDWMFLKASELLREAGRPICDLTTLDALDNQQHLRDAIVRCVNLGSRLILDGHLLIETTEGPLLVPDVALSSIGLVGIIAVAADADILSKRRTGAHFTVDREELADLMSIEISHARRLARRFAVPFFTVRSDDARAFYQAASVCFMNSDAADR